MAHTYATVGEADDYLVSNGSVVLANQPAAVVAQKLAVLEAVSRRIDFVCHRSGFRSGFGPRIGTNLYDGAGGNTLYLNDDLLTATTLSVASIQGATPATPVLNTDYFLANADGYTGPPWRKVILHGRGSPTLFGNGFQVNSLLGSWGYQDVRIPTGTTVSSGLSADAAATSFTTSASPALSPGMTLYIGTEHLYLRILATTTATVVRGANGSTAVVHVDTSAISRFQYPSQVTEVALRLFTRRWKSRDAGADGTDGGGQMPGVVTHEGEDLIIKRGLSDLMYVGQF